MSMSLLQAEAPSAFASLLPMLAVVAVFYFIMIRPQQNQQKKRRAMLSELKAGDKVVTVGGIHGEITGIDEDEVTLRIGEKVEIRMSRSGIGRVKGKE